MNILSTLAGWAKSAWSALTGLPGDVAGAYRKVWHYITNVHNALAWIVGYPQLRAVLHVLYSISAFRIGHDAISKAFHDLAKWIWITWLRPGFARLNRRITSLRAWAVATFQATWAQMYRLYFASLAYTRRLVGIERAARIKADQAEHAAMLKAVAACLATVQRQASSGYNAGTHARLSVVSQLLNDLADRTPAVRGLVSLLVKSVFDLETIDNPVLRAVIGKLLSELVAHLGVDKATGDLVGRLLAPFTGGGPPADLYSTERAVADRLTALEQQWADFMAAGGPEVEQAGQEWKAITGIAADAAILGLFGLAVADPRGWAASVADTIGVTGNDTLSAVIHLISDL